MQNLTDFVSSFTEKELRESFNDYDILREDVVLKEGTLKKKAEQFVCEYENFLKEMYDPEPKRSVKMWAHLIGVEVCRVYAHRYLSMIKES